MGRTVSLHAPEASLQEARAFQRSAAFAPYRRLRQAAEHRIARLMQLGVRQARYFGRARTLDQLLLAATVANLTLVASRIGLMRDRSGGFDHSALAAHPWRLIALTALRAIWANAFTFDPPSRLSRAGFRPGFYRRVARECDRGGLVIDLDRTGPVVADQATTYAGAGVG
jgi:hypothetical protein